MRTAATFIALSWFALRGYPTAVPIEPQAYDLLATFAGGIQRVQVKSGTHRVANGRWQVGISRRPYVLDKTAAKTPYDPESLDYFFVVDGAGSLYLIPSRVVAGQLTIYADHYSRYRVGDASSLLTCTQGSDPATTGHGRRPSRLTQGRDEPDITADRGSAGETRR